MCTDMHTCLCIYICTHTYICIHIYSIFKRQTQTNLHEKRDIHWAKNFWWCVISLFCVPSFRGIHSTSGCVWKNCLPVSWGFCPLLIGFHLGKVRVYFDSCVKFQFHISLSISHYITIQFWVALTNLDLILKHLQ